MGSVGPQWGRGAGNAMMMQWPLQTDGRIEGGEKGWMAPGLSTYLGPVGVHPDGHAVALAGRVQGVKAGVVCVCVEVTVVAFRHFVIPRAPGLLRGP